MIDTVSARRRIAKERRMGKPALEEGGTGMEALGGWLVS